MGAEVNFKVDTTDCFEADAAVDAEAARPARRPERLSEKGRDRLRRNEHKRRPVKCTGGDQSRRAHSRLRSGP